MILKFCPLSTNAIYNYILTAINIISYLVHIKNGGYVIMALLKCILCVTMLLGVDMKQTTIQEYLISSSQAQVIIDGKFKSIDDIDKLNSVLIDMLQNSHTMPAFGVSIHTETIKAINSGVWLKLQYNGTQIVDDMPFDELLIEINPEYNGFNIIRGERGIYQGRCYYIDLVTNDMDKLFKYLESLQ